MLKCSGTFPALVVVSELEQEFNIPEKSAPPTQPTSSKHVREHVGTTVLWMKALGFCLSGKKAFNQSQDLAGDTLSL